MGQSRILTLTAQRGVGRFSIKTRTNRLLSGISKRLLVLITAVVYLILFHLTPKAPKLQEGAVDFVRAKGE